jgi:Tfp pilus assembly protein PilO
LARNRHQTVIRAFQIAGASLLLLDGLLYFGVFRPTQALVSSEQAQFAALRRRIFDGEVRIEDLKKFRAALPEAGQWLASLERDHTPPRRQAFSQAKGLVRRVTEQSGTQLASVNYKLDNNASGPLLRLGLVINTTGSFPALLKFAHGLETASDLVLIRSFSLAVGDNGTLDLRLAADLYVTP